MMIFFRLYALMMFSSPMSPFNAIVFYIVDSPILNRMFIPVSYFPRNR
jgi:hypothetical protein